MSERPHYCMEVLIDADGYLAQEHLYTRTLPARRFAMLNSLIWHVKQYAGLVVAPVELWSELTQEGILIARDAIARDAS